MQDAYIGTIVAWAAPFAPTGWMFCQGQTLQVAQNKTLFALIGTTYGGNATEFKLPNLCGRVPLGAGMGTSGAHNYALGATGGAESVALSNAQLPTHTHPATLAGGTGTITNGALTNTAIAGSLQAVDGPATSTTPTAGLTLATVVEPAGTGIEVQIYGAPSGGKAVALGTVTGTASGSVTGTVSLLAGTVAVGTAGNSAPVPTLPPYTTVNYIICVQGYWPPRD